MRDEPSDPVAQDRFARLLTGVAEVPARSSVQASTESEPAAATVSASAVLAGLSPGRRAMKPLIAVAVCVALVAAFVAWRSRPEVSTVSATVAVEASPVLPTSTAAGPSSSSSPLIVVAVQGRVRHPGLVKLPAGSRVADAIDAAGGVLPGTDVSYVNLAQKVADGQLIVIGKSGPAGGSGGSGGSLSGGSAAGSAALIDLNTASESDFDTLPGIGPALAGKIVAYRTQHGSFRSVDELRNVSGIGDSKFAEIKDLVTV